MQRMISAFSTRAIFLCLIMSVGVLVAGCDSGGSNGGGKKSGTVTAKVEGEATGSISVEFAYGTSDGTCRKFAFDQSFETPGNKKFDPTIIPGAQGCSVDKPKKWDKVEVTFSPDGSADGLSLTLTSGGSDIASVSSPNGSGNLVATVGSVDGN